MRLADSATTTIYCEAAPARFLGEIADERRILRPHCGAQPAPDRIANLRAATTFSFNDFISNGGILVAGLLVWWLGSNWPDLLVGFLTAIIAIKGGVEILRDARKEARQAKEVSR